MIDRRFIDKYISENKQYPVKPEDSWLWRSIKQGTVLAGLSCTDIEAQGYAKKHCNSLAYYTLCKARGYIEFNYSTWVEKLLLAKLTNVKGFLGDKVKIAKLFGFSDKFESLVYFENYEDAVNLVGMDIDKGYEVKVYSNSGEGDHFMPCYIEEETLWVSDPSNRGIHKKFEEVVPVHKFQFLLEV